jgi:hypothetical protein
MNHKEVIDQLKAEVKALGIPGVELILSSNLDEPLYCCRGTYYNNEAALKAAQTPEVRAAELRATADALHREADDLLKHS